MTHRSYLVRLGVRSFRRCDCAGHRLRRATLRRVHENRRRWWQRRSR